MDEDRLLATEHGIPWKLPQDTTHFRNYTRDKWLLLGRHTFAEMRGWFRQGHTPLVLTSQRSFAPEIGRAVASVPQAIALTEQAGQRELVVCGGGQVYQAAMPYADQLVITRVHHRFPSDGKRVLFPAWKAEEWRETERTDFAVDSEHPWAFSIVTLLRVRW